MGASVPRGKSQGVIFTQLSLNSFIKDLTGTGLINFILFRLALEEDLWKPGEGIVKKHQSKM